MEIAQKTVYEINNKVILFIPLKTRIRHIQHERETTIA